MIFEGTPTILRTTSERPISERPISERPISERPISERPISERPILRTPKMQPIYECDHFSNDQSPKNQSPNAINPQHCSSCSSGYYTSVRTLDRQGSETLAGSRSRTDVGLGLGQRTIIKCDVDQTQL
jgi:hypothetical protein